MKVRRRIAAGVGVLCVALLTACSTTLPDTVVAGSSVVVGWPGELTSFNAVAAPTAGNLDIAAATRGDFGSMVDGAFVADTSFGAVSVVGDDPFVVRYDLAEPSWSDGIPLDAADLLLGWAAAAGYFDEAADAGAAGSAGPADSAGSLAKAPTLDEFGRAIEVTFPQPNILWQTAVSAQVPAHVVGARAFGLNDPMQAKQAVIRAIQEGDRSALDEIAEVWNHGFDLGDGANIAPDLLVSSGPYEVDAVSATADGQRVTLVPNPSFRGAATAQVARVELLPSGADPVAAIGSALDIAQVAPRPEDFASIRELERRDVTVQTTHDGTVWSILLDPAGVFGAPAARAAFLRMVPASDLVDRGAGEWGSAYTKTTSMLAAPGSSSFQVVTEDSGFTAALGTPADDAALDREAAGVATGTSVCVLYDRGSTFAAGAFAALRDAAGEAGWTVIDCGSDGIDAAAAQGGWNAVIGRVAIPQTPSQLASEWGSTGEASARRLPDAERDALIAQYAQTTDVYDARELLAQIEASIVRAAVARPIAVNPVVTVIDTTVTGVAVRNGTLAPLTSGIAQWAPVP